MDTPPVSPDTPPMTPDQSIKASEIKHRKTRYGRQTRTPVRYTPPQDTVLDDDDSCDSFDENSDGECSVEHEDGDESSEDGSYDGSFVCGDSDVEYETGEYESDEEDVIDDDIMTTSSEHDEDRGEGSEIDICNE